MSTVNTYVTKCLAKKQLSSATRTTTATDKRNSIFNTNILISLFPIY